MSRFSSLKHFEAFTNAEWEYFVQMKSSPSLSLMGYPIVRPFRTCQTSRREACQTEAGTLLFQRGAWKTAILVGCGGTQACHTCTPGGGRDVRSAWSTQWVMGQRELLVRLSQKGRKDWKKKERALLCSARALHSASAVSLRHRIGLPSLEQPGYSSNQIFLSSSCFLTLTLPIHTPWLQAYNPFIFFKLKCQSIGIFQTLVSLRTTVKKRICHWVCPVKCSIGGLSNIWTLDLRTGDRAGSLNPLLTVLLAFARN